MRKADEPKLCPDCPFKSWWSMARQNLLDRQYTRVKEEPSNLRICIEVRRIAADHGLECAYFKDTYFRDLGGLVVHPVKVKAVVERSLDSFFE